MTPELARKLSDTSISYSSNLLPPRLHYCVWHSSVCVLVLLHKCARRNVSTIFGRMLFAVKNSAALCVATGRQWLWNKLSYFLSWHSGPPMLKRGGKNKKVPPMEFLMGVSHAQILTGYTQTNNSVKSNFLIGTLWFLRKTHLTLSLG